MNKVWLSIACSFLLLAAGALPSRAVELRIGRDALERTLKQQLFAGPNGRFYLKGTPSSACAVYADDARVAFVQDRIPMGRVNRSASAMPNLSKSAISAN
jgi:hypothetical protein